MIVATARALKYHGGRAGAGAGPGERGGAHPRARQPRGARGGGAPVQGAGAGRAQPLSVGHRGGVRGGARALRPARAWRCTWPTCSRAGGEGGEELARGLLDAPGPRALGLRAALRARRPDHGEARHHRHGGSTAPTASNTPSGWSVRSPRPRRSATGGSRSASPRPSARCPTIRPCSTGRAGSRSRSTRCASRRAPASSWRITGDITTMPGLPRTPNAEGVDVTPDGVITGLF